MLGPLSTASAQDPERTTFQGGASASGISQDFPHESLTKALRQPGNITFRDTPLAEVILILSEQWKVNIVAGAEITGKVSGTFKNESLEEILDSILTANGFGYQRIGNSLIVRPGGQAGGSKPSFAVDVIDIPSSHAGQFEELMEALRLQMSPDGQLQAIQASGKLVISDTPERIQSVKTLLTQIVGAADQQQLVSTPNQPVVAQLASTVSAMEFRPQFVSAKELQPSLQMVLGDSQMSVLEEENVIVVLGNAAAQEKARLLMHQLDRPRPQVRITGYIYDVDLSEVESLGIDWNMQTMSQGLDANGIPRNLGISQGGLLVPNPPNQAASVVSGIAGEAADAAGAAAATGTSGASAAAATGGQMLFRTLNSNFELQTMIQALEQTTGSRLLADPHVTVVDRHKATLGIVTEIPVQTLTQTQQGGAIGTTSFREAGITLEVTPRIASDGTIEMEVSPEFSALSGFQQGNPIIDTRRATTVVRVAHGQALVIGGLRSKTTVETVKGIPGLMDVKFLGRLFRTHATNVRESELVVFIMPEIVGYCGGLEREMVALDVERRQLSNISTAVDGAITPDCRDKHCPQHHPRERIHNGLSDIGLIGNFDGVFIGAIPLSEPSIPMSREQLEEPIGQPIEQTRPDFGAIRVVSPPPLHPPIALPPPPVKQVSFAIPFPSG